MSSLKYRPEIDGLRAIAVLAVVVYHAHISYMGYRFLPGGFLGVDIFFVISGYLISKIILSDMQAGIFSFREFYERRARRILPALFLVLAVCVPFACFLMLPKAFGEFSDSVLATLFFGSNFFFWLQDSYTAVASDYKPLLHTWSLAVEEQFYLFFPPLLLVLFGKPSKFVAGFFFLLFVASLSTAQFLSYESKDAAFFLLPTRAWELVAGYIVAKREFSGRSIAPSRWLTWIGLVFIVAPLFLMNDTQHHPGVLTFIPVLGSMMILSFGRNDPLLSLKPVVLVGLMSYSLYLWHQPVFAFARIDQSGWLTNPYKAGLIALSMVLTCLSWYFVERPFRDQTKISSKTVWSFVLGGTVLFVFLYGAQKTFDLQGRISPVSEMAARAADTRYITDSYRDSLCSFEGNICTRGTGAQRWIMLGDSHLDRVAPILWSQLKDKDVSMTFLESGGCGYAVGTETRLNGNPDACGPEVNKARHDYLLRQPPSTIVVMARYSLYIEGTWMDNKQGGIEDTGSMLMRPNGQDLPDVERKAKVQKAITESMNELVKAGHRLILVYPSPEMGWDVPAKINEETRGMDEAKLREWSSKSHFSIEWKVFEERTKRAFAAFDNVPDSKNVIRVYPDKALCDKDACYAHRQDNVFYGDDDHLSQYGATILSQEILKASE